MLINNSKSSPRATADQNVVRDIAALEQKPTDLQRVVARSRLDLGSEVSSIPFFHAILLCCRDGTITGVSVKLRDPLTSLSHPTRYPPYRSGREEQSSPHDSVSCAWQESQHEIEYRYGSNSWAVSEFREHGSRPDLKPSLCSCFEVGAP